MDWVWGEGRKGGGGCGVAYLTGDTFSTVRMERDAWWVPHCLVWGIWGPIRWVLQWFGWARGVEVMWLSSFHPHVISSSSPLGRGDDVVVDVPSGVVVDMGVIIEVGVVDVASSRWWWSAWHGIDMALSMWDLRCGRVVVVG
jgi:hypothetical protein